MPKGVLILPSYYDSIKDLPDDDRLALYDAICIYGLCKEQPTLSTSTQRSIFKLIVPNIDAAAKRYEASQANGKKGGRPKKKQTQNQPQNQTQNQDLDLDKDLEKDLDLDCECEVDCGMDLYQPLTPAQENDIRNTYLEKLKTYK